MQPHPRLEVDPGLLKQIQSLRAARDSLWTRFEHALAKRPATGLDMGAVLPSMFAFLVTGEPEHFDYGWQAVRGRIYRNGTDRAGGLMPLLGFYKGDRHEAAYQGGVLIAGSALACILVYSAFTTRG